MSEFRRVKERISQHCEKKKKREYAVGRTNSVRMYCIECAAPSQYRNVVKFMLGKNA